MIRSTSAPGLCCARSAPRWRVRALILSFTILAVVAVPSTGTAQSPEPTAEVPASALVEPAVVYIETTWSAYVRDHEGDWLNEGYPYEWTSRCSGFVVNPSGYIVTAGHCVDDGLDQGARMTAITYGIEEWVINGWILPEEAPMLAEIAYANWHVEGEGSGTPPDSTVLVAHGRAASGLDAGEALPARVVEFKSLNEGDVALLKVEQSNLPTLQIADDATVSVGTPIISVGYPASSDMVTDQSLEPTFKDGQVSSEKTREGGLLPVFEISAAVSGGMSGGPTVNLEGEVVGVNSFSIVGEEQQFNFLSPASLVTEMLSRNGVTNEPGTIDTLYRDALDAFYAGDYAGAMDGLTAVLDRMPSHSQAQELRSQAATRRDEAPVVEEASEAASEPVVTDQAGEADAADAVDAGEGTSMTLIVALVAGLIILGLAGALFVVARRKGRAPEVPPASTTAPQGLPTTHPEWTPAGWNQPVVPEPHTAPAGGPGQPATSLVCSDCHSENPPGAGFCSRCGHSLNRPEHPLTAP